MANLKSNVDDICQVADSVIKNPSESAMVAANRMGKYSALPYIAGAALLPIPSLIYLLVRKVRSHQRQKVEKELMLRTVISKQQAIIRQLENQQDYNKTEIGNLKQMLEILMDTEQKIRRKS